MRSDTYKGYKLLLTEDQASFLDNLYATYWDDSLNPSNKPKVVVEGTINCENLPYPIVNYPDVYGAFMGFQTELDPNIYFCSCQRESIINYLKLKIKYRHLWGNNIYPEKNFIICSNDFPKGFVQYLLKEGAPNNETVIDYFNFKPQLCHVCNKVEPYYKYCVPMYGTKFVQSWGYYVKSKYYYLGVKPLWFYYLEDICPDELKQMIDSLKSAETDNDRSRIMREINNIIENVAREDIGVRKIGDRWTNETSLYNILRSLYPGLKLQRHYRPPWLNGLELDIFIKNYNLGIEYQGIQHFEAIEHWGGEENLKLLQERDNKKKNICTQKGINLVYFYYHETLSDSLVANKLDCFIKK